MGLLYPLSARFAMTASATFLPQAIPSALACPSGIAARALS
jgi:hypothetical protein